jgi:hypothetical protein
VYKKAARANRQKQGPQLACKELQTVNREIEEQTEVNIRRQQQHFKCRCKKRPYLCYIKKTNTEGRQAGRKRPQKEPKQPTTSDMRHTNAPVRLHHVFIFTLSKHFFCFALELKSPAVTDIRGTRAQKERWKERKREKEREIELTPTFFYVGLSPKEV